MKKFKIKTEKTVTKTYYLTYEIEAENEEEAHNEILNGGYIPVNEEFYDEDENEKIYSVEEL